MSFAKLVGGEFDMGSPVGEPGRDADEALESVAVGSVFMGVTPVTQEHWFAVMGTNPSAFTGTDRPVESVSFADAQRFCGALNRIPAEIRAGRRYRLPTEAEWEWAVRAGTTTAYHFGDDPVDLTIYGWYEDNSGGETHDVLSKSPNDWQLYDMPGNVWEWCFSSRLGGTEGYYPVRGGAWNSPAEDCRSASRDLVEETERRNDIGFRVICDFTPPPPEGVCEFVVEFNGTEVYRKQCYEGPTCRDSSDSASVTVDYEHGTLRWIKQEYRPLEYRVDPETGCTIWYCGDCECTCKELCATIYEEDGSVLAKGTLPDTAYECEPPLWAGVVGEYEISLSLRYDSYNRCVIAPTVNGIDRQAVLASGCKQLSATIELDQYRTLSVVCKECDCEETKCVGCCPEGVPKTLYVSGGILGTESVALTCEDCDIGPCDDATLKVWKGSFITGWYYLFGYGSGCSVLTRWYFRARLDFTWTCGSGYNLTVSATVFEEAHITPGGPPVGSGLGSDTQNVGTGCGPLLNIFDDLCVGDGWMLTEPAVHCGADPPGTIRCPQIYVVTI